MPIISVAGHFIYQAITDVGLIKLGGCAGKDGTDFALVVAMTVLVVEGDVAYAGPAVLNDGVGVEFGHGEYGSWLIIHG